MLKTRVLSGIVLVIIATVTLLLGGPVLLLTLAAISFIAYFELSRAIGLHQVDGKPAVLEIIGYLSITVYYVLVFLGQSERFFTVWMILTLLFLAAAYVFTFPRYAAGMFMGAFFSILYAPVMFSYIYMTRCMENGFWLVCLVFMCSWMCDTCAYFTGMKFGKHKLAPVLSPKKSIEGAIGGVVGTALTGIIYDLIMTSLGILTLNDMWMCIVIGIVGSIFSQIGDLCASGIKRHYNIKDYGTLIPGHGGIMDRFDSVIVTAPLIYFLAKLFIQ